MGLIRGFTVFFATFTCFGSRKCYDHHLKSADREHLDSDFESGVSFDRRHSEDAVGEYIGIGFQEFLTNPFQG